MKNKEDKRISRELLDIGFRDVGSLDEEMVQGKGLEYYESSEVTQASVFHNAISGHVGTMTEDFAVRIRVHGNEISTSCTCKDTRQLCKHVIALLYSWVQDGNDFVNIADKLDMIRKLDKERLIEVITNIIEYDPALAELFLNRKIPQWYEIDPLDKNSE
ncbi:hypothetical protein GF407_17630 [candidate division KSB1 bacterium]|nr:hypothetical protein [candidate division KSB1 bacterium]